MKKCVSAVPMLSGLSLVALFAAGCGSSPGADTVGTTQSAATTATTAKAAGLPGVGQACEIGIGCAANAYCDAGSVTNGFCSSKGVCVAQPFECSSIVHPVCGCDGNEYANACLAEKGGTSVAHSGACITFTPPAAPGSIADLNTLIVQAEGGPTAQFYWLDSAQTYGFYPNAATGANPLDWIELGPAGTAWNPVDQSHAFEPNEMHKLAPIFFDIANFTGGASIDPLTQLPYAQVGQTLLATYQALLTPGSPVFANFLTDWKDQAIVGYPIPFALQNKSLPGFAGFVFTPDCGTTELTGADGQPYAILSAAAHMASTCNPAAHVTANDAYQTNFTTWQDPASSEFDEEVFQAINRFLRGDLAGTKALLDGAAEGFGNSWDGTGFDKGSGANAKNPYRGEPLGQYLAAERIVEPVLAANGMALKLPTVPVNGQMMRIDQAVEYAAWLLFQTNGRIPASYASLTVPTTNPTDNETSIAMTYPYAYTWHERVRRAALSGRYNLTSQPADSLIVANGQLTPDGSQL